MRRIERERAGFSLIELIVVIAIIAVLAGLLLGAVQRVRSAAARAKCGNQVRQLALALHQYHDANRSFPAGVSYKEGKHPQPHMTWLTRLLPYVEQDALWRMSVAAFEQEKFFEKPPHLPILGHKVGLFVCPTDVVAQEPWNFGSFTTAYTSYLGVSGTDLHSWDGVLHTDAAVTISAITDGTSNTLVIGERAVSDHHNFGWWYAGWGQAKTGSADSLLGVRELREYQDLDSCPNGPYHFKPGRADNRCDALRFWSNHPGGATFGFADGSVRFLRYESDTVMPAFGTRAGNESVELD